VLLLVAVVVNLVAAVWTVYRARQKDARFAATYEELQQLKGDVLNAASLVILLADERVPEVPPWIRRMAQEVVTPTLRKRVQVSVSVSDRRDDEVPSRRVH